MNKKLILIIVFATFFLLPTQVLSQVFSFQTKQESASSTFPAGTLFRTVLMNEISTKVNKVGDPVYFKIPFPVYIGSSVTIPAESIIIGKVVQLERPHLGKDAFFIIILEELKFPDGWGTPIRGRISTPGGDGVIGGQITERMEYKKIPHYIEAVGPIVQLKKTGTMEMGKDRKIMAGMDLTLVLDQDLTVEYLGGY